MKLIAALVLVLFATGCGTIQKPISPAIPNAHLMLPRVTTAFDGVSMDVEAIAAVKLGTFQSELYNANLCNESAVPTSFGPQRVALQNNLQILSRTQATFLLSRRRTLSWSVTFERAMIGAVAIATIWSGVPAVAYGIPIAQSLMDFFRPYQIDIQPFLDELLPPTIVLSPKGTAGECVTGSFFASQTANAPLMMKRGQVIR